jgi:flagellar hook assembly protein FlgD
MAGVQISVMDIWGRTVWSRDVNAGVNELTWNGKTNVGAALRGVYLVRIANVSQNSRILAESKVMLLP